MLCVCFVSCFSIASQAVSVCLKISQASSVSSSVSVCPKPITERLSHRTDRGAGWRHVQQLMYESDQQCYDILRMNQRTFEALCKMLAERYGLKETHHVYLEESVAMFLETVAQDKTKRDIAARYQRSVDTVQRKLDDVLSALLKFAEDTLRPQEGEFGRVSPVLRNDDQY